MKKYLEAAAHDRQYAIALYRWNTQLAAAYWPEIEALEISLRNCVAQHLFPDNWIYQDQLQALTTGKFALPGERQSITRQTFGFWVYLLSNENNNKIWTPVLHKSFRSGANRRRLHTDLRNIQNLRNRIGHHESIWDLNLESLEMSFQRVFNDISGLGQAWVKPLADARQLTMAFRPQRTNAK